MKPVCVPCRRFFRPKRNGYRFIEGMPTPGETRALPGTQEPERWEPYKLWIGDLYECEGCGAQIVSGFGRAPIAEHYQPEFADACERSKLLNHGELVQVNDC